VTPTSTTNPVLIEGNAVCDGCSLDNKCYPYGYRKDNNFCKDNRTFIAQLNSNEKCDNNFECSSNVCVSGKCVDQGLLQKIMNWFKKLFG
jgi:hypothetical protein